MNNKITEIYNKLFQRFSKQHWWPADTKDEIIIGTILTQNTAWTNVEKAVTLLKQNGLCSLEKIYGCEIQLLKECIKPAGFFNQKAVYLKNTAEFFVKNGGVDKLSSHSTSSLRDHLLNIKGIGKETADSILLYAFNRPVFVVDSYTKRLIKRHNLSKKLDYDNIQMLFEENLEKNAELFMEYHALIVKNAKEFCRKKPKCDNCPLNGV